MIKVCLPRVLNKKQFPIPNKTYCSPTGRSYRFLYQSRMLKLSKHDINLWIYSLSHAESFRLWTVVRTIGRLVRRIAWKMKLNIWDIYIYIETLVEISDKYTERFMSRSRIPFESIGSLTCKCDIDSTIVLETSLRLKSKLGFCHTHSRLLSWRTKYSVALSNIRQDSGWHLLILPYSLVKAQSRNVWPLDHKSLFPVPFLVIWSFNSTASSRWGSLKVWRLEGSKARRFIHFHLLRFNSPHTTNLKYPT